MTASQNLTLQIAILHLHLLLATQAVEAKREALRQMVREQTEGAR